MQILITGGAGFMGSQLAFFMSERGHKVVVMDNLVRRGSELNLKHFKRRGITFLHGDVRNREDFAALPREIDVLCDTSAQASAITGYANPTFDLSNNALGLVNALEFARTRNLPVIFWSTSRVYSADLVNSFPSEEGATRFAWSKEKFRAQAGDRGVAGFDPDLGFSEELSVDGGEHSIYGLSKLMADLACQEYANAFGVKTVINRFSCVAGPGQFGKSEQGWVTWWAVAHRFGLPLSYIGYGGKQVRDVVFSADVCRLVEMEIQNIDRVAGQVFNIGGGVANSLSLLEATALLREKTGRDVSIAHDEPRKADHCIFICDNRKAERVLGWKPLVGIHEGYDRILHWVDENEADLRVMYGSANHAVAVR